MSGSYSIPQPVEFEWDKGNRGKNAKHHVEDFESEEPFFDPNKVISPDIGHSQSEPRRILLGRTKRGRVMVIVFTIRGHKVRIISARNINRRERKFYEKTA